MINRNGEPQCNWCGELIPRPARGPAPNYCHRDCIAEALLDARAMGQPRTAATLYEMLRKQGGRGRTRKLVVLP
jgi:hypothetical protein